MNLRYLPFLLLPILFFLKESSAWEHHGSIDQIASRFLSRNQKVYRMLQIRVNSQEDYLVFDLLKHLDKYNSLPSLEITNPNEFRHKQFKRHLHLRLAAWLIWLEVRKKLPWSFLDLSDEDLNSLLSYEKTFSQFQGQFIFYLMSDIDQILPWFNELQKSSTNSNVLTHFTRSSTINAFAFFLKEKVRHNTGEDNPQSMKVALAGGRWGSCNSAATMMMAMSMGLGIPAAIDFYPQQASSMSGHFYIDFPSEKKLLLHGDFPYSQILKETPVSEFFIKQEDRNFFHLMIKKDATKIDSMPWLFLVKQALHFPTKELNEVQCHGPSSFAQKLYQRLNCSGCPSLRDFSDEVERLLENLYSKNPPNCNSQPN